MGALRARLAARWDNHGRSSRGVWRDRFKRGRQSPHVSGTNVGRLPRSTCGRVGCSGSRFVGSLGSYPVLCGWKAPDQQQRLQEERLRRMKLQSLLQMQMQMQTQVPWYAYHVTVWTLDLINSSGSSSWYVCRLTIWALDLINSSSRSSSSFKEG